MGGEPFSGDADVPSLRPPLGWRASIKVTQDRQGTWGGQVELFEGDKLRCRMSLSGVGRDEASAVQACHGRIAQWLSDYVTRPHSGDSGFAQL
ncbi:hypothetical protein ACFQ2A_15340 [Variovorax dokdonensis]